MREKQVIKQREDFLTKLNNDTTFRNQFLDDPVGTLREFGISVEPEYEKKIEATVSYLKDDIKHIFEIPSGSSKFLEEIGFGFKMPPEIEVEPDIKVT